MILDEELIPEPKERLKIKIIRVVYYIISCSFLLFIWGKNLYLNEITKDLKSSITLGEGIHILNDNIILCIILFVLLLLGFIKSIYLDTRLKLFGLIGIIICLNFTLGPIRDFMAPAILEMQSNYPPIIPFE